MPLLNGATSIVNLKYIENYLDDFKPSNKNNSLGGLYKIKHKIIL